MGVLQRGSSLLGRGAGSLSSGGLATDGVDACSSQSDGANLQQRSEAQVADVLTMGAGRTLKHVHTPAAIIGPPHVRTGFPHIPHIHEHMFKKKMLQPPLKTP